LLLVDTPRLGDRVPSIVLSSALWHAQEIGIRIAFGADRAGITALVVHEARSVLTIGAAVGLATLVVLSAIGRISAYVPASRAATIDPVSAIRRAWPLRPLRPASCGNRPHRQGCRPSPAFRCVCLL